MSLVNDSLKFTSSDTQICWNFLLKKMCKSYSHFFSKKFQKIVSAKTVNEITLNKLVKLTTLWTTGPRLVSSAMYGYYGNDRSNRSGKKIENWKHCTNLRGLDTPGWFFTTLYKGDNFCDFWFTFLHPRVPSRKGSNIKGTDLLPVEASPFLFRVVE